MEKKDTELAFQNQCAARLIYDYGAVCVALCESVLFFLPFFVSVPFELWRGHSGGVTLQRPHAAHLGLRALGSLYCRRICGVTHSHILKLIMKPAPMSSQKIK